MWFHGICGRMTIHMFVLGRVAAVPATDIVLTVYIVGGDMELIFLFMGGLCIAESVDLFMGKDFLMFAGSSVQKSDYDLDKVFAVEKWVFLADAACCFLIASGRISFMLEWTLMVICGLTLVMHVYVFKSKRFRKSLETDHKKK